MIGDEFEQHGTPAQKAPVVPQTLHATGPELNPGEIIMEPLMDPEKLSLEIERFSGLSAELSELLSRLRLEIQNSAEQLSRIRSAVDAKKGELKTLHDIEASAVALERLIQDQRQQRESFERSMTDQRAMWEEEKAERTRQEKEYLENLLISRERDEEDYRQAWAAEKLKAQQQLEEELRVVQQEGLQRQQALEKDLLERELTLREKELEWVQLIQELEQFMSKLTRRAQAHPASYSGPVHGEAAANSSPREALAPEGSLSS
jgi:hypothetical protein